MNYVAIMSWIGWITWGQIIFNAILCVILAIAIKKRIIIKLDRTSEEEAIAELYHLAKKYDIKLHYEYSDYHISFLPYGLSYKVSYRTSNPKKALKIVKSYMGLIRRDTGENK